MDLKTSQATHDSIEIDLTSDDSVEQALQKFQSRYGKRIASVIHLAAYFDFSGEDHPLYRELNVEGSARLLRALQAFQVGQFVFSSTMLVHAPAAPGQKIDERAPIGPRWIYPQSKARAEEVIRVERGEIPVVLLRLAGLYDGCSAVPTLAYQIKRIYERTLKGHVYSGGLDTGQSTVHRDDLVDAFRRTVERRDSLPEVTELLIGEEDVPGYDELQNSLGELIHGQDRWRTLTVPKPLAKAGAWMEEKLERLIPDAIDQGKKPFIRPFMIELADDHYALDISRAREVLGWEPRRSLRETLPEMVAALKSDPLAWYESNGITPPNWLESAADANRNVERLRANAERRFRKQHANFLWAHFLTAAIGCWLMVAPSVLGYGSGGLAWSDLLTGMAIVALGLGSLSWQMAVLRFLTAVAGVWLMLAPLVFWEPTSAGYLNGTIMGALVVGFSALARPTPGVSPAAALTGPSIPPGWSASPSSWFQRIPIIMLAFVGLFCSMSMAAFQLGYVDTVWDPFFDGGDGMTGTARVITSDISEAFPVPDAGLGAIVYMLEILLGVIGGRQRWRTMPWVVAAFGLLIVPLGIVSITFIVIQPILIGTWCALCLIAAAAMLMQIAYSLNELVATGQFLSRRHKAGSALLQVFFSGDTDDGPADPASRDDFERPPRAVLRDIVTEGIGVPWNLLLCVLIGVWLMFTRATLGSEGGMADADHLIGALVVTVSVIAFAEVGRALRYLIIPLGIALLVTPFLFEATGPARVASLICGLVLMAACLRRGAIRGRYGDWTSRIF
jgi:nucleoside-diphosphate-sugar epimerase/uncharacterized membrane protein